MNALKIATLVASFLLFDTLLFAQDCPPPTCIDGITVNLLPQPNCLQCAAIVNAIDLIEPDTALCTPDTDFAIYRTSIVDAAGSNFVPDPSHNFLQITDSDENPTLVHIYIFNTPSDYTVCTGYILIQEHSTCDPFFFVSGVIATEDDETVENVTVSTTGTITNNYITGPDGVYHIDFDFIDNLTVTPTRTDNPLNGVSTFDLILIQKHILSTQTLDSPYKLIAADVNQSGTISTIDIIQIRKLILGIYTEFPSSDSWRFVLADYVFPNPLDPSVEEFPETIEYEYGGGCPEDDVDFIAIKMGDVNGNAIAN